MSWISLVYKARSMMTVALPLSAAMMWMVLFLRRSRRAWVSVLVRMGWGGLARWRAWWIQMWMLSADVLSSLRRAGSDAWMMSSD